MLENMKNRRTIRKYTTQDIPDALLNELLEVAARASNTGNMQLYSVRQQRKKDWESAIWERRLITQIRLSMPCRFHTWLSLS